MHKSNSPIFGPETSGLVGEADNWIPRIMQSDARVPRLRLDVLRTRTLWSRKAVSAALLVVSAVGVYRAVDEPVAERWEASDHNPIAFLVADLDELVDRTVGEQDFDAPEIPSIEQQIKNGRPDTVSPNDTRFPRPGETIEHMVDVLTE